MQSFDRAEALRNSARFISAKKELLASVAEASHALRAVRTPGSTPGEPGSKENYLSLIENFVRDRGRDLYFPFLSSGMGSGPYVELMDGSVKLDLISAIGVNFFGHSHPTLMAEAIDAVPSDVMQGNLQPGIEAARFLEAILSRVKGSRLTQGWATTCGTMANEIALKIIRQKKTPATRVLAFRDCFGGRSTAMQEITDNPAYRQGQPVYGEVDYLTFGDAEAAVRELKERTARYPDRFCALMVELVQGEGGFRSAPREFFVRLFDAAKDAGLAIWLDEIQTVGRTGELFAFQKLGLSEYVDVVTAAKILQAGVVLFAPEFNPKPGLVAGTYSSSTLALRSGKRILELMEEEGMYGPEGKIERLSGRFVMHLKRLRETTCAGKIGEIRAFGGMIAFVVHQGRLEDAKSMLARLFDLGAIAFYCGHDPYLIRLLPPLGAMTEADVDLACELIGRALP